VFASLYIHGHLIVAAISLTMAVAYAISGWRVPGARNDFWFTLTFLITASVCGIEMALATHGSLGIARAYLATMAFLLFFLAVGFHAQYGRDVFQPRGLKLHRLAVAAHALLGAVIVPMIAFGVIDQGKIATVEQLGVRSVMIAAPAWGFWLLETYVIWNGCVMLPLLVRPGERREERRNVAVVVLLVPLVGTHELLICYGVNPMVPVGGYFAALAGLVGVFVLVERFRMVTEGRTTLGQYVIEKRLGGGGMADVWLARRKGSGELERVVRKVALKRMRPELAADPSFVQMFLHEARIIARLSHPHIVSLHDVGQAGDEIYLAMELVEGAALSRVIRLLRARRESARTAAVIEVGVQLADALSYAHALTGDDGRPIQLIHRDVSPQNVMVMPSGHVKLTDFGIARSTERAAQTATNVLKGKLTYLAPEQVRGDPYDQRVDLYALGVVLLEVATGARPFDGDSDARVLQQIIDGRPHDHPALQAVPAELREIIRWLLEPSAEARPKSALSVLETLLPMRDEARGRAELGRLAALAVADQERRDGPDTVVDRVN
jgi:hypothetical protein